MSRGGRAGGKAAGEFDAEGLTGSEGLTGEGLTGSEGLDAEGEGDWRVGVGGRGLFPAAERGGSLVQELKIS